MVTVISGKLGSGKSYDCVRRVRDHLAHGGCVRTNIRLDTQQIGRAVGRRLSPRQVGIVSVDAPDALHHTLARSRTNHVNVVWPYQTSRREFTRTYDVAIIYRGKH